MSVFPVVAHCTYSERIYFLCYWGYKRSLESRSCDISPMEALLSVISPPCVQWTHKTSQYTRYLWLLYHGPQCSCSMNGEFHTCESDALLFLLLNRRCCMLEWVLIVIGMLKLLSYLPAVKLLIHSPDIISKYVQIHNWHWPDNTSTSHVFSWGPQNPGCHRNEDWNVLKYTFRPVFFTSA